PPPCRDPGPLGALPGPLPRAPGPGVGPPSGRRRGRVLRALHLCLSRRAGPCGPASPSRMGHPRPVVACCDLPPCARLLEACGATLAPPEAVGQPAVAVLCDSDVEKHQGGRGGGFPPGLTAMRQAEVSPESRACARKETSAARGRALAALALSCCLVATGCVHHAGKGHLGAPGSPTSPPTGRPATPEASPGRLPSVDGAAVSSTVRAQLTDLVSHSVVELSTQSGPSDPRYFRGGTWESGQDGCFRCNVGPGVAAAALAGASRDPRALTLAMQPLA